MKKAYITDSGRIVKRYVVFLDEKSIQKIRYISLPEEEMLKGHIKNYNPAGNLMMYLDFVSIASFPS